MAVPICTVKSSGTTESCTNVNAGVYSKVTVGATYNIQLLTPIVSNLFGNAIHLSASTTAVVQ